MDRVASRSVDFSVVVITTKANGCLFIEMKHGDDDDEVTIYKFKMLVQSVT